MEYAHHNDGFTNPMEVLNGYDREAITSWLQRALQDREQLPKATPDEPPEVAIHRGAQSLKRTVREDLRDACRNLVHAFVESLNAEGDDYLVELLSLSWRLDVQDVADLLYVVASDPERFSTFDPTHQQQILLRLVDFKMTLPVARWRELLQQDNWTFASPVFLGLLLHGPDQALQVLPLLPDDTRLGNSVACVLENYWEDVDSPAKRQQLLEKVGSIRSSCKQNLASSLSKWLAEHDYGPFGGELEDALANVEKKYPESPQPSRHYSARLTPAPQI